MPPMILSKVTFEQYAEYYHSTSLIISGTVLKKPLRPLNDKQLHTAYRAHIRKIQRRAKQEEEKKRRKRINRDQEIRFICERRDGGKCRLQAVLTGAEWQVFNDHKTFLAAKLDAAHVFGKSAFSHMRYVPDNVVLINRMSHNWLDAGKSPISGKPISAEEKERWWQRIVGNRSYDELEQISREGNREDHR